MSFINSALQQRQNLGLRPNPPGAAAPGPALLQAIFKVMVYGWIEQFYWSPILSAINFSRWLARATVLEEG
jgi:hypothetical protein